MSRSLERHSEVLVGGVFQTVLTCPAGHKYEVLQVFLGNDGVATPRWLTLGGGAWVSDRTLDAGKVVDSVTFANLVLYAGQTLVVVSINAPGADQVLLVNFLDVDYGD